MNTMSQAQILTDVSRLLGNFRGREYSGQLGPETLFFADLGLASIDAVVLGERLEGHYGKPLPFGELLAELGRRTDRDLSLGELVRFLHRNLAGDVGGNAATSSPAGQAL